MLNMEITTVVFVITCSLSVSCGGKTGIDTSFFTGNSFIQQTTEEFNRFCPQTKTCVAEFYREDGTDLDESTKKPCCEQCSCLDDCGLNCCPDKLFTFTNEKDFYDAKELTRCVTDRYEPFFRLLNNDHPLGFEMVSNCPFNYSDGRTVKQCRREYHEFNFQMPLRNFLPAYDQTKRLIYKNIFCAVCHNADINDLDFAYWTYSCENKRENLTYIHDLTWNASRADGKCNFRFVPRDYWRTILCESNYINQCNVTGRWKKYDRQLEEKCLSYTSDYNGAYPAVYRNVHCFLCNGFSEHNIITDCPIYVEKAPFSTSLDFRNAFSREGYHAPYILLNKNDHEYNLCQKDLIYNVSEVQNWSLECPIGMVLSGYTCFPPAVNLHNKSIKRFSNLRTPLISMYVSLLLEPDHSKLMQHKTSLFAFLSLISTEAQNIFSKLVTKNILFDYYITVSMDLEAVPTRNVTIDFDSIKEIPLHTKVTLVNFVDLIYPILDFSLLFNNLTHMGDFKVKIRRKNPLAHDNIKFPCFFHDYLPRNVFHCPDNKADAFNYHILMRGSRNNPNHYTSPEVIVGVEREPFCPRIALKKLAFVENTGACKDLHKLSQILTDDFLSKQLSENETHIFFCYKDYLQQLNNLKLQDDIHKGRSVEELAFIYLTIVCLSASILSLLITIIIYALFAVLRTLAGLNIMALSIALLVYHSFSLVSTITFVDIPWLCSLIGIVIHFFMVQSFGWMVICTYHMMKVFIKIRSKSLPENISRRFIIHVICATLVATSFVAVTIFVAEVRSDGEDIGYGGNACYIKDPVMIMCVAAIPVALVIILNFCMFCVVLFKISRLPSLAVSKQKERQNTVIFVKLSTLTGLSSIFGFVFLFTDLYAFGYLYVVLNGGQGVFIMISFIFNHRVRNLVQSLTRRQQN